MTLEELMAVERPLRIAEVAEVFGVDRKTVSRWARSGKLPAVRTPGGHWRILPAGLRALIEAK